MMMMLFDWITDLYRMRMSVLSHTLAAMLHHVAVSVKPLLLKGHCKSLPPNRPHRVQLLSLV